MAFVFIPGVDVDHAISRYEAGESIEKIAREIGISRQTLRRRMKAAGYKLRPAWQSRSITCTARYGDLSPAVTRYLAGAPMTEVCKEFSIGCDRLEKAIRAAGHEPRSQAQSLGLRYTRMTVSERRSVTAKANIAVRGGKRSQKSLERRAKTMEMTLQLASRADLILGVWLAQRGLRFTPQKAVGPYNIDISIDESLIAVEVNGDWHYFPERASAERQRREYLFDRGWKIIDVVLSASKGRPWKWLRPACADKIVAMLEAIGCDKAPWGKHTMIWGDGETVP